MKCKQCVQAAEKAEREAAAQRRANNPQQTPQTSTIESSTRVCARCQTNRNQDEFHKNQWNKGPGVSKCRSCVEATLEEEKVQQQQSKDSKLTAARQRLAAATTPAERVAAESQIAALEAQKVTGLQPVRLGRGGRGRGRGRGRR